MVTRHWIPAIALLLTAAGSGHAEYRLPPGIPGVADMGATSCETLTHMYPGGPTGTSMAVIGWAQGYIFASSGMTLGEVLAQQPPGHGWNFESLSDALLNYCSEHPGDSVPEAVADLWRKLRPAG